ncbi:MAG: hypothetical protein WCI05_14115, partial [Myxococcales bacterium]
EIVVRAAEIVVRAAEIVVRAAEVVVRAAEVVVRAAEVVVMAAGIEVWTGKIKWSPRLRLTWELDLPAGEAVMSNALLLPRLRDRDVFDLYGLEPARTVPRLFHTNSHILM